MSNRYKLFNNAYVDIELFEQSNLFDLIIETGKDATDRVGSFELKGLSIPELQHINTKLTEVIKHFNG